MINLVFFLEGQSEKEMLKQLLPRMLLPKKVYPSYYIFNGKKDLEDSLYKKIQGWKTPNSMFVVLLDQDQDDCQILKNRIVKKCEQCKSINKSLKYIVRIACHELESWYFGDLEAVGKAFNKPKLYNQYANKRAYKNPDRIHNPSKELVKITNKEYQKISGSRTISKYLSVENNKSQSFKIFINGIKSLI